MLPNFNTNKTNLDTEIQRANEMLAEVQAEHPENWYETHYDEYSALQTALDEYSKQKVYETGKINTPDEAKTKLFQLLRQIKKLA